MEGARYSPLPRKRFSAFRLSNRPLYELFRRFQGVRLETAERLSQLPPFGHMPENEKGLGANNLTRGIRAQSRKYLRPCAFPVADSGEPPTTAEETLGPGHLESYRTSTRPCGPPSRTALTHEKQVPK